MIGNVLAALGMCADGVAEGLYAVRHGFRARAAALGYAIGAFIAWTANAVTPLTFTVESIAVATRTAKSRPQIFYIVVLSAIPSVVLGALGLYSVLIDFLDEAVIAGTIAGVGIILTGVAFDYLRARPIIAGSSVAAGLVAFVLTTDLVIVIIAALAVGTVSAHVVPSRFVKKDEDEAENDEEGEDAEGAAEGEGAEESDGAERSGRFGLIRLDFGAVLSRPVIMGAFAVFALRTGAVVSYDTVNANLADQEPTLDAVTMMAGAGSLVSGLFGGPPVEATPAPMAEAPDPVLSTVMFMVFMAIIAGLGLIKRIGSVVPLEAIAGFLLVLGIPIIMPEQLPGALESPLAGGTALAVTALSNPFYGILAGQLVVLLLDAGLL